MLVTKRRRSRSRMQMKKKKIKYKNKKNTKKLMCHPFWIIKGLKLNTLEKRKKSEEHI